MVRKRRIYGHTGTEQRCCHRRVETFRDLDGELAVTTVVVGIAALLKRTILVLALVSPAPVVLAVVRVDAVLARITVAT